MTLWPTGSTEPFTIFNKWGSVSIDLDPVGQAKLGQLREAGVPFYLAGSGYPYIQSPLFGCRHYVHDVLCDLPPKPSMSEWERKDALVVDHVNGDIFDYTMANLEVVTRRENFLRRQRRMTGLPRTNFMYAVQFPWETLYRRHGEFQKAAPERSMRRIDAYLEHLAMSRVHKKGCTCGQPVYAKNIAERYFWPDMAEELLFGQPNLLKRYYFDSYAYELPPRRRA